MAHVGTLYSQLNPISFSEFSPSRVTRVSSNPFLQEHSPFPSNNHRLLQNRRKEPHCNRNAALSRRKYIQLEFSNDEHGSPESLEDFYSTIRRCNPAVSSLYNPESVIRYTHDSLEEEDESANKFSASYPGGPRTISQQFHNGDKDEEDPLMDRPLSFAIAIGENPIFFDREEEEEEETVCGGQSHSQPPLSYPSDFDLYQNFTEQNQRRSSSLSPCHKDSPSDDVPFYGNVVSQGTAPLPATALHHEPATGYIMSPQICIGSMENILQETGPQGPIRKCNSSSTPNLLVQAPSSPSSDCHTAPIAVTPPHLSRFDDDSLGSQSALLVSSNSSDSYGRYPVTYLGSTDVSSYSNCINECAKKMLDPSKSPVLLSDSITVDITSTKIRFLQPKSGALLKSLSLYDVFFFSQCTKNKRLVGIVIWRKDAKVAPAACHLFRCPDQLVSNAFMESLTSAKQDIDCQLLEKLSRRESFALSDQYSDLSLSISSSTELNVTDVLHKWPAVHVATVKVGKTQTVGSIIKKAISEHHPSDANVVSVWASLAQIRLVQSVGKKQLMYGQHEVGAVRAIGADHNDKRLIGYIVKEKSKPPMAYVIWCYTAVEAGALVSFLRQACQSMYHQKAGKEDANEDDDEEQAHISSNTVGKKGLLSLFRSLKPAVRSTSGPATSSLTLVSPLNSSSTFQSYVSSQQISSSTGADVPHKCKNSVTIPKPLSSFESAEEDFAKFSVNYVGSANLDAPFSSQSIINSLEKFKEGGTKVGQASVPKNTVIMHISSLGINLTDKKQKMFINRNYPQKQIIGHSVQPVNGEYFGFATFRPGFKDQIKVHVFCQLIEPVQQILDTMSFWLNIQQ